MNSTAPLTSLPRSYVPADREPAIRAQWDSSGVFHAEPAPGDDSVFCTLIPPPNVTAALHLGHAFNNTLQDLLVRYHRMRGERTLWMPGTDHAGIATQAVVEKRLLQEGTSRRELGRAAFVARVQSWKDEYEATITDQLKAIGASCDWARQRFTMDPICTRAVRAAFFRLFRESLIYRGKRLVNWDPVTLTALADDEVEMTDVEGFFWYLRYPLVDDDGRDTGEFVTVATTRPETMLGDTAVAVNPDDPERARLAGRRARLPIVDRIVPVVADSYVVLPDPNSDDPKARYASGFLKVTPAHDPNDWDIGIRHELPVINVMAPDASISDQHGWTDVSADARALIGLSREDARVAVVEWFDRNGLLEATRPYEHAVGHSYRSHVPVEPYMSDQWYVRVTDDRLVGEAQRAVARDQLAGDPPPRANGTTHEDDGVMRFSPARYARTYEAWHENLRDWCVSRQLWWGHRIPVWRRHVAAGDAAALDSLIDAPPATPSASETISLLRAEHREHAADQTFVDPETGDLVVQICVGPDGGDLERELETHGFEQDADVLDTWFSSALWPISTMGWPDPERFPETVGLLETFTPTSVLSTAREIITLWVSRMVMFTRFFHGGRIPFRDVNIHAMIQDGHGQKMSKSLGNGVDPRDCIHTHGADALRFTMAQMATATQDVRMPVAMLCPHCEAGFDPKEITTAAKHVVAAPTQTCPSCSKTMVSGYGAASGEASPTDAQPLARNTSSRFDLGRNFANKLWNATRFALSNAEGDTPADGQLSTADAPLVDRWIVSRLHAALHQVEDALGAYQFNVYADAMYDFVWRDFCDWYLEAIKPTVRDSPAQQQVLRTVLNATLRMLHPMMPFVTEALWPHVEASGPAGLDGVTLPPSTGDTGLVGAAWPDIACRIHDEAAITEFTRLQELTNAIRTLRGDHRVPPKRRIELHVTPRIAVLIEAGGGVVETLAGLAAVLPRNDERPAGSIPIAFEGEELLASGLVDAVDLDAERTRLEQLVAAKAKAVGGFEARLSNAGYVSNAPAAVVEETRRRHAEAAADLDAARAALDALGER